MTVLFVAVSDALLVVSDGGGRWVAERRFAGRSRLMCVTTDPRHPERVYCGTASEGLWRSDDLGGTWSRVGEGVLHERVTAVAVSGRERVDGGSNRGNVGRGSAGESVLYAGTEPTALYRSEDAGETWKMRHALLALPSAPTWSFPPRPHTSHVRWIATDPLVPERIFVAIEAGALVTSSDGGLTWTDRRPGSPYDTHTLVVHPQETGRLYSAAGDGYFESTTSGVEWERREDGLRHRYLYGLAVEPDDPETIVISASRSAM
ncbi:MAG TPA: sialidase family protein, partial [Gemmatimonadaceae bacterium]|nr:sialidase family protein [Gemmatimonadaceae bacterium]